MFSGIKGHVTRHFCINSDHRLLKLHLKLLQQELQANGYNHEHVHSIIDKTLTRLHSQNLNIKNVPLFPGLVTEMEFQHHTHETMNDISRQSLP